MNHLALQGLKARKMRLLLTSMAIIVSIGFMAGTLMLSSTVNKQIGEISPPPSAPDVQISTGTNSVVVGPTADPVASTIVDKIEQIDGVDHAAGVVEGYVNRADGSFQPVSLEAWRDEYAVKSGSKPSAPSEIVASETMAASADLKVGDTLRVVTPGGELHTQRVVGIYWYGKDEPANRSLVGIAAAPETASDLLGLRGRVSSVDVWATSGTSAKKLARTLTASDVLPDGYSARTYDANFQQLVKANALATQIITYVLLGFAGLSLFVGIFMIFNTFSILVAQRSRELGALRAIGASRRQVRRLVATESTVVGLVGSIVGIIVGWCICALVAVLVHALTGFELFAVSDIVIAPSTIAICLLIGVIVTRVAAMIPARRASRVSPIAALGASSDREATRVPFRKVVLGVVMIGAGVGAFWLSQVHSIEHSRAALVAMLSGGSLLVFIGMIFVSPICVAPMTWIYSILLRKWLGMPGQLGLDQARGTPRRVAATSVTFMIGLGVVATAAMPLAAMQQQMGGDIRDAMRADIRVTNGAISPTGVPTIAPGAVRRIGEAEGVARVTEVRSAQATYKGDLIDVRIVDPAEYAQDVALPSRRGTTIAKLGSNEVLIASYVASDRKLHVGDAMKLKVDGETQSLRVAGIHDGKDFLTSSIIMSDATWASVGGDEVAPSELLVTAASGVDPSTLKRRIVHSIESEFPTAAVRTEQDMQDQSAGSVKMVFNIILGLCGAALIVALFGIANTVALSLHERTRELGMLRAIGMTRRQMRRMVRWEAITIGSFGSIMGICIGLILGGAIVLLTGLSDHISIPWGQLMVLIVVGVVAGVVASALPAWRTSRLDVLDAISSN